MAFDKMRSKSVVVFVNSKAGERAQLPDEVREGFADSTLGNTIPMMVVFDSAAETKLGGMSYAQIKSGPKGFRDINKAIKEGMDAAPAEEVDVFAKRWDGTLTDTEVEDWVSSAGTKIRAKAVRVVGDKISLVKEDGKSISVPLSKLDSASETRAKELIEAAKAAAE